MPWVVTAFQDQVLIAAPKAIENDFHYQLRITPVKPGTCACAWSLGAATLLTVPKEAGAQTVAPAADPPGDRAAAAPASEASPAPEAPKPYEVTVVGTSVKETPGSAHVVKKAQLERFRYTDALPVLSQVPGVYVRQEDGMGLRPNIGVRGVNPDRSKKLTLMEDGILFGPAPYSAPAAYYFPLISRMVSVRVIKGPGALVYGPQTVGGAVDLVTRPVPTTTSGAVDAGIGEYGFGKLHGYVGSSDGQIGFLVEGIHLENSGFKQLPNGADTGFARNEWMGKVSYRVDPAARETNDLALKVTYSDETSNETYLGLTDADFRANPYQRYAASALDQMKNHRTSIVASHTFGSATGLKLTTTAYRNDYARIWRKVNHMSGGRDLLAVMRDPSSPPNAQAIDVLRGTTDSEVPVDPGAKSRDAIFIGPNDRTFVSQGVQTIAHWERPTGPFAHRIEFGVRLHNDSVDRRHSEDSFLLLGGSLVPDGEPTEVTLFNRDSTLALALHAVDAITWKRLTLTPGVRIEAFQGTSRDKKANTERSNLERAVLPGIGAYYGFNQYIGALAGAYSGFGPPPPGSVGVRPERSVNYELGSRLVVDKLRAEVIGFYNDYSNLTDICTESSSCTQVELDKQFDAGKARIYGLEAYAADDVPVGRGFRVPFTAAYTLTRAELRNTYQSPNPLYGNFAIGDEVPYVPRHQFAATLGLEHDRGGVAAAVYYVSAMREQAGRGPLDQTLATDPQAWVDASAYFRAWKHVKFYADLRNVTGAAFIVAHRPYGARPNAPRWLQVGVKVDF
jgi:Fe(3+) dicitrate transport protein